MPKKKVGVVTNNQFKSTGKKKVAEFKPFEVGAFKFFPCNFSTSKKGGYVYFLLCRDGLGHVKFETLSPRFKNKEEAEKFVYKRSDFSIRPI